jgi:hypothetical protein
MVAHATHRGASFTKPSNPREQEIDPDARSLGLAGQANPTGRRNDADPIGNAGGRFSLEKPRNPGKKPIEGGESHLTGSLHKNPINNRGQKIRGGAAQTRWWYRKVKPQYDSVRRSRRAKSRSPNI